MFDTLHTKYGARRGSNRPLRARVGQRREQHRRTLAAEKLEERVLLAVISHWTANNTTMDAVGTNHASLISGTTYATGQVNQAFSFDGIDDRVQLPDSLSLKLTRSMTIEGWVRANSLPAQHGMILFRGDDRGGFDPYWLSVEPNGQVQFTVEDGTTGAGVSTTMPLGQIVHVTGTLDDASGVMRLYLNGVLMSQTTTTVRPFGDLDPASNPGIGIGNHGGYPTTPHNFPFHGLIDELKVYDAALTAEEVLANFNVSKGSLQPAVSISDTTIAEGDTSIRSLGVFVSTAEGGLNDPHTLIYGPDGALYVSTRSSNSILRYDAVTGVPFPAPGKPGAEFVSSGAGGLSQARGIAFGPDGNLYAVSTDTDSILRYDGNTGDFLGAFIASGAGGLDAPRGLLLHTDGYLYVTSAGTDSVLRFDGATGAPAGTSGLPEEAVFIASGSGGLDNPSVIVSFGGIFYVSSTSPSTSNSVLRYAADGTFLSAFVPAGSGGLSGPTDLVFHDGYLYVTSWTNNKILRYDGASGEFVNEVASAGGLVRPVGLVFESNGNLLVSSGDSDEIRRYGVSCQAAFTVSLNAPFPTPVSVDFATADGTALLGSDYQHASGTLNFTPGMSSKTILVQTVDNAAIELNETFAVTLTGVVGAVISDSTGVGTIIDNDTKFYVVDDAVTNRTFEYGSGTGTVGENYALNSGNTSPRGAASTVVGDKVWVVDANKKVYVYSASGGLLGSWTAGTLSTKAVVEGIATNGTDIWIVDAYSDKVYKYAGAAAHLSGTWTATSFSLNSANKSPKDIVTDGVNLWVVNDSTPDKVFKYTTAGTLVSSWTITTAGAITPTGITIDPANVNNIWIVDNGTDRVYQYNTAATFTNGSSHAADVSFALAAGNTNPQGIADPPTSGSLLVAETPDLAAETALRGSDAALEHMYYEPLKKVRIDTVRRSESRAVESHTRDLSYTVGASANRLANDSVSNDRHHTEVDDLFAQWDSDPLELLSFPDLGA